MTRRAWLLITSLIASTLITTDASGQGATGLPSMYKVDYTFERATVDFAVDDVHDRGTVKLFAYIYRPLKNPNGEVVVFPHGSLGGLAYAPHEPFLPPRDLLDFLLARVYAFVAPYRRGFNESGGALVEECAYQAGECTLAQYRETVLAAIPSAIAQTAAVVDHIVLPQLKPRDNKIILWGGSRGGLLAILYAAAYPAQVRGVVTTSAGTLSMTEMAGGGKCAAPQRAGRDVQDGRRRLQRSHALGLRRGRHLLSY